MFIIENVLFQAAARVSYYPRQRCAVAMVAAEPGLSVWPPFGPRPPNLSFILFLDFLTVRLKKGETQGEALHKARLHSEDPKDTMAAIQPIFEQNSIIHTNIYLFVVSFGEVGCLLLIRLL